MRVELKKLKSKLAKNRKGENCRMEKLRNKIDSAIIGAKCRLMAKREGSDQLIVMFIIIAVAAGIAGLLYLFGKTTLLPNIQNKLTTLIDGWFNHA